MALGGRTRHRYGRAFIRDIGGDRRGHVTRFSKLGRGRLRRRAVARHDQDFRAMLGENARDALTDALAAASDDDGFALDRLS